MSLYNIRGTLTVPLRKSDTVLRTNAEVYAGLYVKLQGAAGVEVVKVLGLDNTGVAVQREQDNTEALEFSIGDTVEYVLTAAEIASQQPELIINATGALDYTAGRLKYLNIEWIEFGASQFVGEYPNIVIGRDEQAYGCCDGNNNPASIPPVPYYYTSLPYPTYVQESIQVDSALGKVFSWNSPFDYTTVGSYIVGLNIVITVAYRTYVSNGSVLESVGIVSSYVSAVSMPVVVAYRTYASTAGTAEAVGIVDSYVIGIAMPVVVAYITYSFYPIESVMVSSNITGISLV